MKLAVLIIIVFVFFGCADKMKNKVIVVTSFPITSTLSSSEIIEVDTIILNPSNLFIYENNLVICNTKKDIIFDFFQLPELDYSFSGGSRGDGPDNYYNLYNKFFKVTAEGFNSFSHDSGILYNTVVKDKKLEIEKKIKLNFKSYPVNGFLQLSDSLFFYWGGFDKEEEYIMLNLNTKKEFSFGDYPDWAGDIDFDQRPFVYVKNSVVKPDGTRFASFYGYFKHWRIYDMSGRLTHDISVEIPPFNTSLKSDVMDRLVSYYVYPFATDEYIYILCKNNSYRSTENVKSELQIWKWDGTPVASFELDNYLKLFTVSPEFNKLYAAHKEDENVIVVYDLPSYF